jgi:hypothetical protein
MRMKTKQLFILVAVLSAGIFLLGGAQEEWTPTVVISEVAWSGTQASYADEWLELYNTTDEEIDLSGWTLTWGEGDVTIYFDEAKGNTKEIRRSIIPAHGFYILERTDDDTISDIEADLIYKGALDNAGELLILKDAEGNLIDTANIAGGEWPAGTGRDGEPPYASMERSDPLSKDGSDNWRTNDGEHRNGLDAEGNPINGTPGQPNSMW